MSPKGQITLNDQIGRWIFHLCSLRETNFIVEIGTWNGRGSSQCIVEGVLSRTDRDQVGAQVLGLEVDKSMHAKASRIMKRFDWFNVIHGSLVAPGDLDSSNLSKNERDWLEKDISNIVSASNLVTIDFPSIDLLILDGGEFSTYSEFKLLENRLNGWLILDDTETRKCARILSEIRANPRFCLIYESSERNGVAVARVKH